VSTKRNKNTKKNSRNAVKNVSGGPKAQSGNTLSDSTDAYDGHEYIRTPQGGTIKLSMNVQSKEDPAVIKIAKRANRIAFFNIIISTLIILVTTYTFFQTKKSVEISMEGLEYSEIQFQKLNKPFLQIAKISTKDIIEGEPATISYEVHNIGNFPVKLISSKIQNHLSFTKPKWKVIDDFDNKEEPVNIYVSNGSPGYFLNKTIVKYDKILHSTLMGGISGFYYLGFYVYENLITGERMKFYFMLKLNFKDQTYSVEENINIPYNEDINLQ
jgi:hypothetical protein